MNEKKKTEEEYSLYTEKIVPSPRVKYRKLIKFMKFMAGVLVLVSMTGSIFIFIKSIKEKKQEEEKKPVEFVIERDQYYFDDQYREDDLTEEDLKTDYETILATLRTRVEDVKKCIVMLDTSREISEFSEIGEKTHNEQAGLLVAHINSKYMILTSKGVTEQWPDVVVRWDDSTQIKTETICINEDTGISILCIDERDIPEAIKNNLKVAVLGNSYQVRQGDMVIVAGRIYGVPGAVDYATITNKSTINGLDNGYEMFDTNLAGMGDDFGFLFNSVGNIVGITTVGENATLKAIGISDMKAMIENMINHHEILYFGVKAQNVTEELAKLYNLPIGVYVSGLDRNSPAYDAGIQPGDVIVSLGENETLTIQEFNEKLYQCDKGDSITVTVKRYGKEGYNDVTFDAVVGVR
ncbi:MAG: S1C family serine protease [Lachnospira sp.]